MNRQKVFALFVAISCTIGCFYWFRGGILEHPFIGEGHLTEYMFLVGVPASQLPADLKLRESQLQQQFIQWHVLEPDQHIPKWWASRVLAIKMSAWWSELFKLTDFERLMNVYAAFNVVFVGSTFLMLALWCRSSMVSLIAILGTVAGLLFSAAPSFSPYFLQWDMPDMFAFTAAFLCYQHRRWWLLVLVVLAGGVVKESVLPAAFLLMAMPIRISIRCALVICVVTLPQIANLLFIAPAGTHESWMVAVQTVDPVKVPFNLKAFENVQMLFRPLLNNFIFTGAGSLIVLFWIVGRNVIHRRELALGLAVGSYFIGEWCAGIASEYRIWVEVLPLSWILIGEHLSSIQALVEPKESSGWQTAQFWEHRPLTNPQPPTLNLQPPHG